MRHQLQIDCAARSLRTYVAPKVAVSAVRLVRKRKVLVLYGRFRPKRPKNGLCQGHTARTSVDNSTNEAFRNPGSLPSALVCDGRHSRDYDVFRYKFTYKFLRHSRDYDIFFG